jgi:hypothetical protein
VIPPPQPPAVPSHLTVSTSNGHNVKDTGESYGRESVLLSVTAQSRINGIRRNSRGSFGSNQIADTESPMCSNRSSLSYFSARMSAEFSAQQPTQGGTYMSEDPVENALVPIADAVVCKATNIHPLTLQVTDKSHQKSISWTSSLKWCSISGSNWLKRTSRC